MPDGFLLKGKQERQVCTEMPLTIQFHDRVDKHFVTSTDTIKNRSTRTDFVAKRAFESIQGSGRIIPSFEKSQLRRTRQIGKKALKLLSSKVSVATFSFWVKQMIGAVGRSSSSLDSVCRVIHQFSVDNA